MLLVSDLLRSSEVYSLESPEDNTPPTSEPHLLMSWATQVTTKQEMCFRMYIYISTIRLLGEYSIPASYLREDVLPPRARLGSARGTSSSPSR